MRSLPWAIKKEEHSDDSASDNPRKRKRNTKAFPNPRKAKSPDLSDSDDTIVQDAELDIPTDAMILGYDNDDAYIMVEHDLLEAAKQVTRHVHLEAYQKNATAPVEGEITRPTTGPPKRKYSSNVQEALQVEAIGDSNEEGVGKDVTSLGQLLRRRPAPLMPATPIKRNKIKAQINDELHAESWKDGREKQAENEVPRPQSRSEDADNEDEDEDLDPPRKVSTRRSAANSQNSRANLQLSRPSSEASVPPLRTSLTKKITSRKPSATLEPDWIFSSLWGDDNTRTSGSVELKREKVSLAAQLQETSLKMFERKKPISLKDQFKFLEN